MWPVINEIEGVMGRAVFWAERGEFGSELKRVEPVLFFVVTGKRVSLEELRAGS